MPNFIYELIDYQCKMHGFENCISFKEDDVWKSISTKEVLDKVNRLSFGLIKNGVKKGAKIGIVSNNRPEWNFLDFAIHKVGAVNVSVYPTLSNKDLLYIFNLVEVEYIFVADLQLYEKIELLRNEIPSIKQVFTFDLIENADHWSNLLEDSYHAFHEEQVLERKKTLHVDDLASIIFTSGSTGMPKGAMLSHKNFIKAVESLSLCLPIERGQVALSFLPLCHMFERVLVYTYFYNGLSVYYAENFTKVRENILEVKPHMFTFVPRILEKIYDEIVLKGNQLKGLKKTLFFWALNLGYTYDDQGKNSTWYNIKLKIAKKIVFKRWKQALGGNVVGIPCGGAALKPGLAKIFNAAGIYVIEGYGMTEFPVLCANRYNTGAFCHGTVGPPVPGNEIKIDEKTEEILVRNPDVVMMGYYKNPKLTEQIIDKNGWLHTGDKGELIDNQFVKITGRIKEIFKTSGGKYIVPNYLEGKFLESDFVEQIMVIGENKNFVSALIVPSFGMLNQWCKTQNISFEDRSKLITDPNVIKLFEEEVERINNSLGKFEQVKKIILLPNEWTVEAGELTPTMKIRRTVTQEKYAALVSEIYQ